MIELQLTSKALDDLLRLYELLAPVNQPAAAKIVQSLTHAPTTLLTNPRIGEQLFEFEPRKARRIIVGSMRYVMKFKGLLFLCYAYGTHVNSANYETIDQKTKPF